MRKIKCGVVGIGRFGAEHCRYFTREQEKYELVTVCDIDPERVRVVSEQFGGKGYTDLAEFLAHPDMDLVIIATRSLDHARNAEQVEVVEDAGTRILRKCLELGGSITGEHGVGLEKQHLMAEQFSADEIQIMAALREVLNPQNLLNPGKGLPMKRGCAEAFHRHHRSAT